MHRLTASGSPTSSAAPTHRRSAAHCHQPCVCQAVCFVSTEYMDCNMISFPFTIRPEMNGQLDGAVQVKIFEENLPSQRLGISDSMGSHHLRNKRLSSASIRNCFYGKSAGFAERRRRCQLAGKKGTEEATSAGDCSHGTSSFHVRLLMRGCSCRFRTILLAMNSFTSSSCHTKPVESRKMHSKVKERWRERETLSQPRTGRHNVCAGLLLNGMWVTN
jgi:hypothetical protein